MSKAPAVDYSIDIIEYMATYNRGIGISDISNALGINKNAISRVLDALMEKGWVTCSEKSQKKYELTLKPFSVISNSISGKNLVYIANPFLSELNKKLGDAVYLGVKNRKKVLYLSHFDSSKEVRINGRVGGEYPLHCSAPGKVLLSFCNQDEVNSYFSSGDYTKKQYKAFLEESKKIKDNLYSIDNEEFAKGVLCIAVPIFDRTGNVVASIGISSLTIYDTIDSLISEKYPFLAQVGRDISSAMGYIETEGK